MTRKINNETPTKCICHKGFSGYSSVVARSNFHVGGQETAPQSLTAHTLDRCAQVFESLYKINLYLMFNDYGQETYKILTKLLKLTFAKHLKGSGIRFNRIYQLKDLINGAEFYMVEVNNIQIRFKTPKVFLLHFMTFLKKNIAECKKEYQKLITRPIDEFTDEISLEMRYKEIDFYIHQQSELLKFFETHYK